jgi:hypothetical protein
MLILAIMMYNYSQSSVGNQGKINEDVAIVAQKTLDLPALDQYWHPGEPGRVPVAIRIPDEKYRNSLRELGKFDQPVFIADADTTPYFEFTSIHVDADTAAVSFTYPVEGIRGTADFKQMNGEWELSQHDVQEI